jgi:hypothetical protein
LDGQKPELTNGLLFERNGKRLLNPESNIVLKKKYFMDRGKQKINGNFIS